MIIKTKAFTLVKFLVAMVVISGASSYSQEGLSSEGVWTYDFPGGEQFSSPDYEVAIEYDGQRHPSFVHYSYGLDEYQRYALDEDRNLVPDGNPVNFAGRRCTESHSTAIFSFKGTIRVFVTVKEGAKHISLPLKSARILPSSYNIPCEIVNDNTIAFTLDRPEKVVVFPNYDEAWSVFEQLGPGHIPIQNWNCNFRVESQRETFHGDDLASKLSEGYKNPLFIVALPQEEDMPDINSPQTLVVNPGVSFTQEQLDLYNVIWFKPGIHDFSSMGASPRFQMTVRHGQTIYLEGGSYVYARFRKSNTGSGLPATIKGRGVVSGMKHQWSTSTGGQIHGIDTVTGIAITDRAGFSLEWAHHIKDVSLIGGWHGNNDGPDFLDDCLVENCFLVAHDDNLKLNNNTHARHIVIWQLRNAHPIMVKEMRNSVTFSNCVVEDVDILAYNLDASRSDGWSRISHGGIACVNGRNIQVTNFKYRDIRIEAPYLFRVFCFYNLDTALPYTPTWIRGFTSSEAEHSRVNGVVFENITVTSPVILYRSLLGSAYANSMNNIRFINLNVNGTVVTEKNKDEFFEIEYDRVQGLSFSERCGKD